MTCAEAWVTLRCARAGARTTIVSHHECAPLHAARLHGTSPIAGEGMLCVALIHNGGGILAGDRLRVDVHLEEGARVHLSTVGATRIHRAPDGQDTASIATTYTVAGGAMLVSLPDALIPFAGSRLLAHTDMTLTEGATGVLGEIVAAGRVARGEVFAVTDLRTQLRIVREGRLAVLDRLHLGATDAAILTRPLAWGSYTHLANLWLSSPTVDAALVARLHARTQEIVQESQYRGEPMTGAATLAHRAVVLVRVLGHSAHTLNAVLHDLAADALSGHPRP